MHEIKSLQLYIIVNNVHGKMSKLENIVIKSKTNWGSNKKPKVWENEGSSVSWGENQGVNGVIVQLEIQEGERRT